ncbi:MAG TPA: S8 family serine peptidase, partial [Longimicrobiales bacterium]|nr:S8 family serine peptidase [Longimicrobiales bacterium]
MIDTRAGPGRTASTLAAPVLALCLLCVSGSRLAGQGMTGSYRVSGREVDLAVLPDSFAVSTVDPLSPGEVEALVSPVLSGAAAVRRLSPRIWVLGIDPMSRDALGEAVHDLEAIPDVVWAGFVVRAQDASGPAFVTRQFMARFQAGVPRAEIDALNRQHAVEIVSEPSILPQHYGLRVTVASDGDALEMARIYDADPRTVYAHPNLIVTDEPAASWFPTNDPLFSSQWHHYNPGVVISGIRADIHSPEAWGIELGDPNVVIAVLELGGFQTGHPDLAANLWVNPWADGTGPFPNKTGDVHGWNFEGCVWGAAPELDPCGSANLFPDPTEVHGTQVAGMAAEVRDNGVGGLGVCPDCSLMLVRLSMTKDQGVRALGFQYADLMGADVVNVSFNTQYTDPTLVDVVSQAATFGRAGKG